MATLLRLARMTDSEIQSWLLKAETVGVDSFVSAMLGEQEDVLACVRRNMSATARSKLDDAMQKKKQELISPEEIYFHARRLEKLF